MKIPFDIKYIPQIESGEYKVQTKNGEHVEILKWEMRSINNLYPILAVVSDKKIDEALRYSDKGYCGRADYSLFLVTPEPELSEFEKACIRLYNEGSDDGLSGDKLSNESLKKSASELLDLARKELFANDTVLKEYAEASRVQGKVEALKNLPKWKRADRDIISNTIEFAVPYTHDGGDHDDWVEVIVTNVVHKGESYLEISDLEKLPGFNE